MGKSDAETHLNMLGNKIIFEKRLNIQAGNNYFGKKKIGIKNLKFWKYNPCPNYLKMIG